MAYVGNSFAPAIAGILNSIGKVLGCGVGNGGGLGNINACGNGNNRAGGAVAARRLVALGDPFGGFGWSGLGAQQLQVDWLGMAVLAGALLAAAGYLGCCALVKRRRERCGAAAAVAGRGLPLFGAMAPDLVDDGRRLCRC
jgi:hypothetical protein